MLIKFVVPGQQQVKYIKYIANTYFCFFNCKNHNIRAVTANVLDIDMLGWLQIPVFSFLIIKNYNIRVATDTYYRK